MTYTATDEWGNTNSVVRTINVIDPFLAGLSDYEKYAYNLFIEAGYTKEDFIVGLDNQQYLIIEDNEIKSVSNEIEFLVIPEDVITIGNYTLAQNQLRIVVIPDSLTSIGYAVFEDNQLTSIVIPDSVITIGNWAFAQNQLTSVVISDSVTTIGDYAFYYNQLTSVVIPDSVTTIGDYAFYYNQLTEIIFESDTPPTIEESTFGDNFDLNAIYVPDNSVYAYRESPYYSRFVDIIKPISEYVGG
ncbi:MAG TPA: leucine-rich repeat domain-containing protein [Gallicola sp.]|nr:leucine-rich repeat domain-containing protein [Gallicola sp.]